MSIIEIHYKVDIDKYAKTEGVLFDIDLENGSDKLYTYVDKKGLDSSINIYFSYANIDELFGNCKLILGRELKETSFVAKIKFKHYDQYENFILPSWLSKFEYVE